MVQHVWGIYGFHINVISCPKFKHKSKESSSTVKFLPQLYLFTWMLECATQQVLVAEATISSQEERLEEERQPVGLVSPVMMWVNITQDSQGGKRHLYQSECVL